MVIVISASQKRMFVVLVIEDRGVVMKKLMKSNSDAMVWGICGGIGEYLGVDSTVVRIIAVILSVISGGVTGIVVYIILMFIIPQDNGIIDE